MLIVAWTPGGAGPIYRYRFRTEFHPVTPFSKMAGPTSLPQMTFAFASYEFEVNLIPCWLRGQSQDVSHTPL